MTLTFMDFIVEEVISAGSGHCDYSNGVWGEFLKEKLLWGMVTDQVISFDGGRTKIFKDRNGIDINKDGEHFN